MTGQVPPGWYRDPYGTPGLQRYWDGNQWTQATQPSDEWEDGAPATPPAGPQPSEGAGPYPQGQPQGFGQQGPGQQGFGPQQGQQPHQSHQGGPEWAPPGGGAPGWGPAPQQQYGWQPAPGGPPPQRNNTGLILGLAGGGVAVIVVLIVVVLIMSNSGDDPDPGPTDSPTTALSPAPTAPSSPSASPTTAGRVSPVTGTVSDIGSELSYSQLGGTWERPTPVPASSTLGRYGFARGSVATVQRDYNGANTRYVSSYYSGVLTSTVSTNDLETAAKNLFTGIQPTSYPQPNTKQDLESKAYSVNGKRAWYYKTQLSFPQSRSRGWNFDKETIVVVTVDRGAGKRPAVFYVSIPDSHENQGDLDLLVNSLRVT